MSFKIQRDTFQQGPGGPTSRIADAVLPTDGPSPGTTGRHPIAEVVGTALTGGRETAGTKGYLAVGSPPAVSVFPRERDRKCG